MNWMPIASDISPSGGSNLDERTALQHFLGKNQTEAKALFRENPLHYSDDLIWMGSRAFMYYFPCFAAYLSSVASDSDADSLNALVGVLECRFGESLSCVAGAESAVNECLEYCLNHFEKFDVDPIIYGELIPRMRHLKAQLAGSQSKSN
jgi:hypothetical protein